MKAVLDLDDIQGLLRTGYGSLPAARYVLGRVRDRAAARAWLRAARPTSMANLAGRRVDSAVQIALTAAGLRALGVGDDVVATFAPEFTAGMTAGTRPRRLGDVGANAPAGWAWGAGDAEPHLLVMLFTGAAAGALDALAASTLGAPFAAAFTATEISTADLAGREPFGFADGISQPTVDFEARREPNTRDDLDYGNLIAPGEFILGYPNEYGRLTERPLVSPAADPDRVLPTAADDPGHRDLGRNGSYLVFRQMAQDVRGFWRYLASICGGLPPAVELAEAMVGRRLSGEPLLPPENHAIRGVGPAAADLRRNGFTYRADPEGLRCPVGAHVRRANPRTGDQPGGNRGAVAEVLGALGFGDPAAGPDVIAASRFHRLLRRGRPYGRLLQPAEALGPTAPDPGGGLHFICLNASLVRQFEFVQAAWIVSSKFGGLSGEQDPLLGPRAPLLSGEATGGFSAPVAGGAARRLESLPAFVTIRGGAYFFLPGLRALRFLAQ